MSRSSSRGRSRPSRGRRNDLTTTDASSTARPFPWSRRTCRARSAAATSACLPVHWRVANGKRSASARSCRGRLGGDGWVCVLGVGLGSGAGGLGLVLREQFSLLVLLREAVHEGCTECHGDDPGQVGPVLPLQERGLGAGND